jgi:hypothetical protein
VKRTLQFITRPRLSYVDLLIASACAQIIWHHGWIGWLSVAPAAVLMAMCELWREKHA